MSRYGVVIEVCLVVEAPDHEAADARALALVERALIQSPACDNVENIETHSVAERIA
jgi:hypothetical protein